MGWYPGHRVGDAQCEGGSKESCLPEEPCLNKSRHLEDGSKGKDLLCEHEDLGSDPQHPHKKCHAAHTCDPSAGG